MTTLINSRDLYLQASPFRTMDSALTREEKPYFISLYDQILNTQLVLDPEAVKYGITTEKTAYDSAITTLTTYLGTILIPVAWNDVTNISVIVREDFMAYFDNVNVMKKNLEIAINNKANINGHLSVPTVALQADSTGVVASLSPGNGIFKVYAGALDVTGSAVTYSVVAQSNLTVSFTPATGAYTLNTLTADSGSATLRAVYGGVTITLQYNVVKARSGATGASGLQTAIVYAYKRSSTLPTLMPGDITVTFATASITTPATDALSNGWTKTIPSGTDALYVTVVTASATTATDTILNSEWATPVIFSQNGLNTATIYIYNRESSDTPPTLPSASCTYTFATGVLTGLNNGWTTSVPDVSLGDYLFVSTATALSTSTTDVILNTEWATANIMAQNGLNASLLWLSSTGQSFTYNGEGIATPTSQTISFTANMQGDVSGTAAFTCNRYNSAGSLLGSVTLGGTGNTRTLTIAQFTTSAAYAIITATEDGFTDTMTVVRLADGTSALSGYLTNESHTVPALSDGSSPSFTGASGTFKVYLGLTDVTSSCTFSVVGTPLVTTTAPSTPTGAYSVTAVGTWPSGSNSTTVTYRATRGSNTIDKVFSLTKAPAGTTGSTGSSGSNGSSYRTAYMASVTATPDASPTTQDDASNTTTPGGGTVKWGLTGTWVLTVPTLTAGQYLYQSDGIYIPTTGHTEWSRPYWSSLKVGSLSAITADLGTITSGDITGTEIRTATSGARITMNEGGDNKIIGYTAGGMELININCSAGIISIESDQIGSGPTGGALRINTQSGSTAIGIESPAGVPGIAVLANSTGNAIYGESAGSGEGVYGVSASGPGVRASSLRIDTAPSTGAAIATQVLTNKPGSASANQWLAINVNGTTKYIQIWG